MAINKTKFGQIVSIAAVVCGAAFIGLSIAAWRAKSRSVYETDPTQKNPLEGKRVKFVADENDKVNADGVRGHLEVVGEVNHKASFYEKYVKRVLDVILSFGGLVVLSPVFGAIALAIKIEDNGPVFFTQKRLGQNKKFFTLHKFRSMKMDTPHETPTHMLDNPDQYITKVGKFIRAHSLDELPQIWDIFVGNLSTIGPRPSLWNEEVLIAERDKYGANDIKPGLTGWAQINGRDTIDLTLKAKLDGEYVKKQSFLFDAKCFLGTVCKVFRDDSVVEGGTGTMKKNEKTTDKKKVLVVCQHYKPEPFRISDICEELASRGYEVQVVTGYPNYPEGIIYDGYGKNKRIDEVINGVKVHRCYTIPRKTGVVRRVMNYYSFAISAEAYVRSSKCVASDGKPFDVVLCNQLSPIMMAQPAVAYKKKYKVPAIMYCLDLWPESLVAGGIGHDSPIFKYFHHVSGNIYREMDEIFVSSGMFIDYLNQQFGIEREKMSCLPQYADDVFKKLEFNGEKDVYDFLFAGNIGTAQSVDTIIEAAKKLTNERAKFHIVGSGKELENLKEMAKGLDNVIFYGRKPLEEMPKFYQMADALLVTMTKDPVLNYTLPGKVQSYMAVGKPMIGAIDGETCRVIESAKCGFCSPGQDSEQLAQNIRKFINSPNKEEMGNNAYKYYQENFQKATFMEKLENALNQNR